MENPQPGRTAEAYGTEGCLVELATCLSGKKVLRTGISRPVQQVQMQNGEHRSAVLWGGWSAAALIDKTGVVSRRTTASSWQGMQARKTV